MRAGDDSGVLSALLLLPWLSVTEALLLLAAEEANEICGSVRSESP